jgi:hypothetical protein
MFSNLSYNELASAAIDMEVYMKAYAEADEMKRKRTMSRSSRSGGSGSAPLKYYKCIPHPQDSCTDLNSSIGAITRRTNNGSFSHSSSNSTTVLLPHNHSRHQ